MSELYAGLEAGGTKFVAAVATGGTPPQIIAQTRIEPVHEPEPTVAAVASFFREAAEGRTLAGVGIASFGPVDVDPVSETWGHITTTPKLAWQHTDLVGGLRRGLGETAAGAKWGFDTDVNGAALAEQRWGRGGDPLLYVTVGTGVGGGYVAQGTPLRGLTHPEMGHIHVPRHPDDGYEGGCPYHGACLEGMAAGPNVAARWRVDPASLPPDHDAWEWEAWYVGHGLASLVVVLSPRTIVVGGGVFDVPDLRERTAAVMAEALAGYAPLPAVVSPGLGSRSGVLGALALGMP